MQLIRIDTHEEIEHLRTKIQEAEKNLEILKTDRKFLRRTETFPRIISQKQNDRSYSLYAREVGAESKNSSMVTPVTCVDVNGDLQMTVR